MELRTPKSLLDMQRPARRPVLDMAVRGVSRQNAIVRKQSAAPVRPSCTSRKSLDGVKPDRRTLIKEIKHRPLKDTLWRFWRRTEIYSRRARRIASRFIPDIAPRKMLYGSLVGGIAFGMVSMAFMERYLDDGVAASSSKNQAVQAISNQAETDQEVTSYDKNDDLFLQYFSEEASDQYEQSVRDMVKGYPIEDMLPYIFEKDRTVAAFLIGIAKKESNWGKRVPVLDGQDCFNYWGYRGVRRMMGTGGHTCFNSRKDAIDTVAKRIEKLVYSEKLNTPAKMIVWKCGSSCDGHSRESVKKWISDVDMYFEQLNEEGTEE